jgi:hypothetical protein
MRVLVVVLALAFAALPSTAWADPPPNDNLANATLIDSASLPFSDSLDTSAQASRGASRSSAEGVSPSSVWYASPRPTTAIQADTNDSQAYTILSAWAGPNIANLRTARSTGLTLSLVPADEHGLLTDHQLRSRDTASAALNRLEREATR